MTDVIKITPPRMETVAFHIRGTAPLMTARFSKKMELMAAMGEGSTTRSKRKREARDYEREMEDSAYRSDDGWYGLNASAFRNAAISACRLVGFKMTLAKLSIFTEADGYDVREGTPLIKILVGTPELNAANVRNANGSTDVRVRPLWRPGWEAVVRVRYDRDQFTLTDITNLFARIGAQVGIGEGRPDSRESAGLGYGLFAVVGVTEVQG